MKDIDQYFEDKKTNYALLVKENVSATFKTFVCGAELELSQVSLNDLHEILHGLRTKAMDKYSFIKIDTTKQFKLQEAKKFHISTSEVRRKIVDDWHEISVVTSILDNSGSSKEASTLSRFGSTKFMEGEKSALDSNYFTKFSMELEKLTNKQNAIGKDGLSRQII